jgi:hypothetical protein
LRPGEALSARKVVGTYWEAQRGDGTPFREFATREQALEYMREFRRLDATGAGRRIVKVTRYAGRATALDLHDAVVQAREEERSIARAVQATMVETHDDYCARAVAKAVEAERLAERRRCAGTCTSIARDYPRGSFRAMGAAQCAAYLNTGHLCAAEPDDVDALDPARPDDPLRRPTARERTAGRGEP